MLEILLSKIKQLDILILKAVNSLAPSWLDWPMIIISSTYFWLIVFLILGILSYLKLDGSIFKRSLFLFIFTFACTDFISGNLIKPKVKRLRPCKEKILRPQLYRNKVTRCGGKYGFFSSHAANSFGIAFLILFLIKLKLLNKILILLLPILVSVSRMYLAKHYPTDLIAGMIFSFAFILILSKTKFFKQLKKDYTLN